MYIEKFLELFDAYRHPDFEVVVIRSRGETSYCSLHRLHPWIAICLTESEDEPDCGISLFGIAPDMLYRFKQFAENEECFRMLEVSYEIRFDTDYSGKPRELYERSSNGRAWSSERGWTAHFAMARAELSMELARMLMVEYQQKELEESMRIERLTPKPEDRYVYQEPELATFGTLRVYVGAYPMGFTSYLVPQGVHLVTGSAKDGTTTGPFYAIKREVPLSKEIAEELGQGAANIVVQLQEMPEVAYLSFLAGGLMVNPDTGMKLNHEAIGAIIARSLGYEYVSLINRITGEVFCDS